MNPWLINPPWQHFCSLVRETASASDEGVRFLRYHHETSALYYAVSFVEAFLNRKMREVMTKQGKPEQEIYDALRDGSGGFAKKLKKWPSEICGKPITVSDPLQKVLIEANELRSDLTHVKTQGHDIYADLESVNLPDIVTGVAEYAIVITDGLGEQFPYWLFGWNFFNPNDNSPWLLSSGDFHMAMDSLGLKGISPEYHSQQKWLNENLRTVAGYRKLKAVLDAGPDCSPFWPRFPLRPLLCKRWWDARTFAKAKEEAEDREPVDPASLIGDTFHVSVLDFPDGGAKPTFAHYPVVLIEMKAPTFVFDADPQFPEPTRRHSYFFDGDKLDVRKVSTDTTSGRSRYMATMTNS